MMNTIQWWRNVKDSGKVILMLHDGSDTDLFDPSECVLVWSADSKRLAYGFRANPPGARVEERSALVCFLEWLGFRQSVFAGKFAVAADQVSQRKGGK